LDAFLVVWNGLCHNLDGVEKEDKDGAVWSYGEGFNTFSTEDINSLINRLLKIVCL